MNPLVLDAVLLAAAAGGLVLTRRRAVFWPLLALVLLLVFNRFATPGFFAVEWRDGRWIGTGIDIFNHGARVMVLALGMTLVIGTSGIDLSVGAVMAIAGAVMATLLASTWPVAGALAAVLVVGLAAGAWNAWLVSGWGVPPIIATLILMVAGRGIAQLVSGGQIVEVTDPFVRFLGNGTLAGVPIALWIVAVMVASTVALCRGTALGLFVEATGDNRRASVAAGVPVRRVTFVVYGFSGLAAAVAGVMAAANIRAADANHAGLYLELDAIMAVVVGGTSLAGGRFHLAGSLVGALLIQTLTTTLYARDVPPEVAPVPKALVVLAVCLLQSERTRAAFRSWRGRGYL